MEPLFLQSEDALYFYLKKFLKGKPKAVQLDGSTEQRKNTKVVAVFRYSVTGRKYKLAGDLTREAVQEFVRITEEQGSSAVALKEYSGEEGETVILATFSKPEGWHCKPYVNKASDRLKDVA